MKLTRVFMSLVIFAMTSIAAYSQNQQQQEAPNYMELAAKQADAFQKEFNLDYAQVFMVDTLYQRVMPAMNEALSHVQKSGASNAESYQVILDRWADEIDRILQTIFDEKQWERYMKSPAGREKKKRDKRMTEAALGK